MADYAVAVRNLDRRFTTALAIKNLGRRECALQKICLDAGALQLLDCAEGSVEEKKVGEKRRVYCAALNAVRESMESAVQQRYASEKGRFFVLVSNEIAPVVADQRYVAANAEALRRHARTNPYDDSRLVLPLFSEL